MQLSGVRWQVYGVRFQVSHVTCRVSHVTNADSHSHRPSPCLLPNMHSKMVCKDQRINFFPYTILEHFSAKLENSETTSLSLLFDNQWFLPRTFVKWSLKTLKNYRQYGTTFHNIVQQTSGLMNWIAQEAAQCESLSNWSKAFIKKNFNLRNSTTSSGRKTSDQTTYLWQSFYQYFSIAKF